MNDTPKDILRKQFDIMYSKPLEKKIEGLFEMTELSRKIIQNRIFSKNPGLSEVDLKVETFKAFYKLDYDERTLMNIASSMKRFLEARSNDSSI
jgi:hypothetical protein